MRKVILRLSLFLLLLLFVSAMIGYTLLLTPLAPPEPQRNPVEAGTSFNRVAVALQRAKIIRSTLALKLLARWNRQSSRIQAGSYLFSEAATPKEVLDRLIRGDVEKVSLTIPEGFTLQQIISRIAEAGFGRSDRLLELSVDPEFIAALEIDGDSLEGYLFPETYLFAPGIDEKSLLKMLVTQFQRHLTEELKQSAVRVGLNPHQLVTLASIIEKETGVVDEMPLISSVFHNRLKRRIPLQTDPTVIYGIKNFDGNITRKHLETPTPYNTYQIRGLPPGPIASPGLAALHAAAHPAATKYLYFVARGDGSHQFSNTLEEHNAAVRQYQLRRRK